MSTVKEELSGIINRKKCCKLTADAVANRDIGTEGLRALIKKPCCKKAALRGAFLAGGSAADPEKLYHLEIYCRSFEFAEFISEIMRDFNLSPKIIKRSDYHSVYLKDGEGIVDFLNITGAHKALMTFENVRIMKEMRSSVNRIVNCETANLEKTVNASVRQIANIYLIRDTVGFESLPDGLRKIAELRAENPEIGLKELGQELVPPLGKSGVNHRLRKLDSIANTLHK